MGLKRLSAPILIPFWLVVLAIGILLIVRESRREDEIDELPTPRMIPGVERTLPPGLPVSDPISELKDGTGGG